MERKRIKLNLVPYIGGKSKIADWIISYFPPHRIYVEVFGGSGAVLLRKRRSEREVYNDIWDDIVCLFKTIRDRGDELKQYLRKTPFSRTVFEEYVEKLASRSYESDMEQATCVFYILRAGFSGERFSKTFITQAGREITYKNVTNNLGLIVNRLQGVVIENMDFRELITKYDSPDTFFYCDSPYIDTTQDFYEEFTFKDEDHEDLSRLLNNIEGKVIVSYYPHPKLEEWYPNRDWKRESSKQLKHMTQTRKLKKPESTELLIMNFKPLERSLWKAQTTKGLKNTFRREPNNNDF